MDLLQLRYFLKVAQFENMTQAAQALHVAQPSLSQTIHRLENTLGVPLFERRGKHIYLNEYGKIAAKYSQKIFRDLEDMENEIKDLDHQAQHTVRLAIHAASLLLPDFLKAFSQQHPDILFRITQSSSLEENDLTLYATSKICLEDTLLLEEKIAAALPAHHPLAQQPAISLKQLAQESFISLEPASSLHEILFHHCHQAGFEPNVQFYCDNPGTFREFLKRQMGVALIPTITWQALSGSQFVIKPLLEQDCRRYLYLHTKSHEYLNHSTRCLQQELIDYFSSFVLPDEPSQK